MPWQGHEKVSTYIKHVSASGLLPSPGSSSDRPVDSVPLSLLTPCPAAAAAVSSLPLSYSQVSNGPAAVSSLSKCAVSSVRIGNSSANIKNSCTIVATSRLPSGTISDSYGPATAGLSPHAVPFQLEVLCLMNQQPQYVPHHDIV